MPKAVKPAPGRRPSLRLEGGQACARAAVGRAPPPATKGRTPRSPRMTDMDPDKNLSGQEARQGRIIGRGRMRLVLITSLVLVVLGFILAWMMV